MARRPTLTQAQLNAIRADYEAWNPYDPEAPSADELAAAHGISKNTMYTWRARGWSLTGRDGDGPGGWKPRGGATAEPQADTEGVVAFLMEELIAARVRLASVVAELESAREQLGRTTCGVP